MGSSVNEVVSGVTDPGGVFSHSSFPPLKRGSQSPVRLKRHARLRLFVSRLRLTSRLRFECSGHDRILDGEGWKRKEEAADRLHGSDLHLQRVQRLSIQVQRGAGSGGRRRPHEQRLPLQMRVSQVMPATESFRPRFGW
ncbi:hypothetical protein GW17_00013201 [Ensete ventricosum]|nr:hypothetical protein GW17_00013201 [Ensete ventricosum]